MNYLELAKKIAFKNKIYDDDIVQELAIKLWQSEKSFNPQYNYHSNSLIQYCIYNARFYMSDLMRKYTKKKKQHNTYLHHKPLTNTYDDSVKKQFWMDIECIIGSDFIFIKQYYIDKMSLKEIAKINNTSINSIHYKINQILNKLRNSL